MTTQHTIDGLEQSKLELFQNPSSFSKVFGLILRANESESILEVEQWTATFLQEWFSPANKLASFIDKMSDSGNVLPILIKLSKVQDVSVYKNVVLTTVDIYDMVFDLVSKTSNDQYWYQLTELKEFILGNFRNVYPLKPQDPDTDLFRSIGPKLATVRLMTKIITVQSTNQQSTSDPRRRGGSNTLARSKDGEISIANINDNHPVLIKNNLEAEALGLFELLLSILNDEDYLIPQTFIAILNNLVFLVQRRQRFIHKIFQTFSNFEVDSKFQFPSDKYLKFKLNKRFVERSIKNALNYMNRAGLIPQNNPFSSKFQKIVTDISSKHDEQKKKGILTILPYDKPNKKASKHQVFPNNSITIDDNSYSSLYQLIDPSNEINQFDVSLLPQQALTNIALATLSHIDTNKLISALSIITTRYVDLTNKTPANKSASAELKEEEDSLKVEENDNKIISVEDELEEDLETGYILPPPISLKAEDKKKHLELIIKKFFELSNHTEEIETSSFKKISNSNDEVSSSIKITKIAINDWSKDSWLILLTRLATRGLRNGGDDEESQYFSDLIRESIFAYFLEDIHNRIEVLIEWLNEEWYSEFIRNSTDEDGEQVETPIYLKWTEKVLEAMIPFLEANDRRIIIRLLSDLPFLNGSLVSRVTSLCIDPQRSSIGFQSLQYLIMFRPPVQADCIHILRDLYKEHEDLRSQTTPLLKKYDPEFKEE